MAYKLVEQVTYGNYNEKPEGWREISLEQFLSSNFFQYAPNSIEHRQFPPVEGDRFVSWQMYNFWDDTGIALASSGEGKMLVYAYGCDHKYNRTKNLGQCLNEYECSSCGHSMEVDSSD